ncbi:MAG: glutamate-1-semialdehyde 2,1-aminomutase [Myxococcaceae bacterium]|nr:glutamate-1-semialdehyde 2,1-aminomutase [Myxococcaceae bacterium]
MPTARSSTQSDALFARAQQLMPAGVNSPVRAFRKVGGTPVFMAKGEGAFVTDVDGHRYVDYCLAWGPLILGHAHPAVVEAVTRTARDGLAFGTCHRNEQRLAELVLAAYAPFERVRFVVSGTEAVLTAVRLARAHTKRRLILKFAGCYHGHGDQLLVKAGSGVVTFGLADSEGVTVQAAQETLVLNLGDLPALEALFAKHGNDLAAVILEPLPANNGLLLQKPEYLKALRALTEKHGTLLIFDEVISGFRFGNHGYGKLVGVQPDLVTLGKIVGGGLPVGAVTGKKDILDRLAPLGGVYQAGTMAGNPVALAAGIATLEALSDGKVHAHLESLGKAFDERLASKKSSALRAPRVGGLLWPYFDGKGPLPVEAAEISSAAVERYHHAYRGWLAEGLYLPPSAYEVSFLSAAHTVAQVQALADALAQTAGA